MNSILIKKIWSDEIVEITDKIKKGISSSELSKASIIVFKVKLEWLPKYSNQGHYLNEINSRCSNKRVIFLAFNGASNEFEMFEVKNSDISGIDDLELLNEIKQADLKEVVAQSTGESIIEAPNGYHFVTPSGKHSNKFIRIADIVQSYNSLDRISYWLLPYLKNISYILIDNWSIASIVLHTQLRGGLNIPFDCFKSHVSSDVDSARNVLRRVGKRHKGGKVLCIVSVSASGKFLDDTQKLVEESSLFDDFVGVSLFALPKSPVDSYLASIESDIKWFTSSEDCTFCKDDAHKEKYYIDPKYYTVRDYKERHAFMPAKYFTSGQSSTDARKFIADYGCIDGALCLHKDDPYAGLSPRHHAYFIDVEKLSTSDKFIKRFEDGLEAYYQAMGIPDLVVFPEHRAGKMLFEIVSNTYKGAYLSANSLENISSVNEHIIRDANHILFLDDVVITGARLDGYNRSLREKFKESSFEKVGYLIAVARPDSEKSLDNIRRGLIFKTWPEASFNYVEKLILPNWDESSCPWCKELNILTSIDAPFEKSLHCEDRIISLRKRDGIKSDGFMYFENSNRVTLGQGSPLASGGASELQVLFTIAHGLQMCRNEEDEKYALRKDIFIQSVLGTKKLFKLYNEPMIQAAFLRSALPHEICSDFWNEKIADLSLVPEDEASHVLLAELIICLNRKFSSGDHLLCAEATIRELVDFELDCQISQLASRFFGSN